MPPRITFDVTNVPAAWWWLAFGAIAAILLAPLTLCEIPPLLDYPNHLARMEILAHGADDAALSHMYRAEWRILPNIAIDATMPLIMRFLPLAVTGKIFLSAALLLPLLGVAALHRALFRVRSLWPLAAGLVVYNRLFFAGFMNFLIGAGLALLAGAAWETRKENRAVERIAVASIVAVVIFFCHLIALVFYGLLLASLELARAWERRRLDFGRLAVLVIPFMIPAILYLNAPIADAGADHGHGLVDMLRHYYWQLMTEPPGLKPYGFLGPVLTYDRWLDATCLILVLTVIVTAQIQRRLKVAPAGLGLTVFLLLAYPVVPFFLLGTGWIDQRLPILAAFMLLAGTLPSAVSARTSYQVLAVLAVAIAARTAEVGQVWSGRDAQLADFRQVIAPVKPGQRVLVVQAEDNTRPDSMASRPYTARSMLYNDATMHLAALLVIENKAFWPLLFTASTKQPVAVLPPYDAIALHEGVPPWIGSLPNPRPGDLGWAPYLAAWQRDFDWVLVLWPGWTPKGYTLLPDLLEPVRAGKVAALYRIRKEAPPSTAADIQR